MLSPRKSGLRSIASFRRETASGRGKSLREVENAITSTSIKPAIAALAARTPSIEVIRTTGSTSVCVRTRVTPWSSERCRNSVARRSTSALVKAARALADAASASANERGRNEVTVKERSAWACRLAKAGRASHCEEPLRAAGAMSAINPPRNVMLQASLRPGNMTEASGDDNSASITLRPEHRDAEALLERAAEAVLHFRTLVGHRRRAQEAGLRLDPQVRERRTVFSGDTRHRLLKLVERLDRPRPRNAGAARDCGVVGAALVDHRQRADGLVDLIVDDEVLEVLRRLRGFRQQAAEIHAERAVGVDEPDQCLRQRECEPEREARGETHRAVHVESVFALGHRPPFVRRHAERADRDRIAAMLRQRLDRLTRPHALSPFARRRVRNSTKGRFCRRQVSYASEIDGISS